MKVSDVMTKQPRVISADDTVLSAAQQLAQKAIGMLPVAKDDRLVGVLTDRDIVVRVVAQKRDPATTTIGSVVSGEPKYCFEDQDTEEVARNMDELLIRRLPVVNRDKRLVGIVSLEDIRPRKSS
ncbi:MAG TPA: CBS domain-containing protein [Steroidobacteraceae bacterium]|jgi:CBS domain-containing protein|nr:CBS domain-containing protein [Steroidobacteraceae bacterium]